MLAKIWPIWPSIICFSMLTWRAAQQLCGNSGTGSLKQAWSRRGCKTVRIRRWDNSTSLEIWSCAYQSYHWFSILYPHQFLSIKIHKPRKQG
jgi:hypothetical protein